MTAPTGPVFISLPGDVLNDCKGIDLGSRTRVDTAMRPTDAGLEALAEVEVDCPLHAQGIGGQQLDQGFDLAGPARPRGDGLVPGQLDGRRIGHEAQRQSGRESRWRLADPGHAALQRQGFRAIAAIEAQAEGRQPGLQIAAIHLEILHRQPQAPFRCARWARQP